MSAALPVLTFFLTYGLITEFMYKTSDGRWIEGDPTACALYEAKGLSTDFCKLFEQGYYSESETRKVQWNDIHDTWWIWLISLTIIAGSEVWLFRPKD